MSIVGELSKEELLDEGWKALTENLGHKNTILFIASIRQAKNNPMNDIKAHWKDKDADELFEEVSNWEKSNNKF